MPKRHVLITGAAGLLGSYLAQHWVDRYTLRLIDLKDPDYPLRPDAEFQNRDITRFDDMCRAVQGIDTVVHLAADRRTRADFYETLLELNIKGAYNVFHAAAESGCRRVVYASSVNAMRGYPPDVRVTPEMPPNTCNVYGSTKVFAESLGCTFHHTHGLSAICVRYGGIRAEPPENPENDHGASSWITLRDAEQLTRLCVETDGIGYAIVHGFSRHRRCRWDITSTCELLGYNPQDGTATP